jgi:hypothetical protein
MKTLQKSLFDTAKRLSHLNQSPFGFHSNFNTSSINLQFSWKDQIHTTAPFGLNIIPYLFIKLTRPLLQWAHNQGIRVSACLDDLICIVDSCKQAMQQTRMIASKLQSMGWINNFDKSVLTPAQQLEHLGFNLDTTTMELEYQKPSSGT